MNTLLILSIVSLLSLFSIVIGELCFLNSCLRRCFIVVIVVDVVVVVR